MAKRLKKAPQQKKEKKNSEKKISKFQKVPKTNSEKRKKCRQSKKTIQVNFFGNSSHPHPLDYTFLIGQRINGKDIELLLPNTNDLRLAYNTKADYICTPGRLGLYTI